MVVKTAFYLPNQQGFGKGRHGALAHLDYMGDPTRHAKADEELLMGSAAIHAKYMVERPGISGYFGPDPRVLPDIDAVQEHLQRHTGPIWRVFVSVTEHDALTLGGALMTREGWEAASRAQLPTMFQKLALDPRNVEWVASVHKKAGHPHLHLLFWERHPHRVKGVWSSREVRSIRQGWVSECYGPERERLGHEKSTLRAAIIAQAKALEPGFLTPSQTVEWQRRMVDLAAHMPGTGRAMLKFLPPSTKAEALETATWLLARVPAFGPLRQRYGEIAAEMAQHYSDDPGAHDQARANADHDLTERLAQIVVKEAARLDQATTWTTVKALVPTDDPATRKALRELQRMSASDRKTAIAALATQLRGEGPKKLQKPLEKQLAKVSDFVAWADQYATNQALRRISTAFHGLLAKAELEASRAAYLSAKERWQKDQAEYELAAAQGLSLAR